MNYKKEVLLIFPKDKNDKHHFDPYYIEWDYEYVKS